MKKILFLLCFFFYMNCNYSQNLVGNPGFENVASGFPCTSGPVNNYFDLFNYWAYIAPWTIPEHHLTISPPCAASSVGSADCLCNGGHNSVHCARCLGYEFVVAPLNTAMLQGHAYYIEFYVKGGTSGGDGGLRLFESRPKQCGTTSPMTMDGEPHVEIPNYADITNWTRVSATIVADHPYSWIGIGSFNNSSDSYFFDDFTIMEVGSSACPDINYIQNTYFPNVGLITYPSQNLTISGRNVASTLTPGNVVVGSTAIVDFKSATRVILEEGFSVEEGARFQAYIAPCNADCFPPVASAGTDATSCSGQTIQLGSSSEFGTTYSWTAVPSSALSYLSNSNTSNPVFTPPPTGYGTIVYTLKATNSCGQIATDNVVVNYETNTNNSPTVSASNINYSDLIEFDAIMGAQTGQLIVELWASTGYIINSYTYNVGVDFNCCTYHWKLPYAITPCIDYQIKIYTKNLCSSVLSAPYIINWPRNRNLSFVQVSNVFTPDGDGVNDSWCFTSTGNIGYNVVIQNSSGVEVFRGGGAALPPMTCAWNGECNRTACSQSTVSDGTYFFVLEIIGCSENIITTNGFISLFRNRSSGGSTDTTSSALGITSLAKSGNNLFITPNPSSGSFTISVESNHLKSIYVYDLLGKVIYQKTGATEQKFDVDITDQPKGMYIVKVEDGDAVKTLKVINQ